MMICERFTKFVLACALALVAMAGLGVLSPASAWAQEPTEFPHPHHIVEEELSCATCHDTASPTGLPALKLEGCVDCHDGPLTPTLANAARRLTLTFPHAKHLAAGDCVSCHKSAAEATHVAGTLMVTPEACAACHETRKAGPGPKDCAGCHGADASAKRPASHGDGWRSQHSAASKRPEAKLHGQSCDDCHGADSCMTCHQQRKPMSHAEHLGERGADCESCHPGAATTPTPGLDLESCSVCHEGPVRSDRIVNRALPTRVKPRHTTHSLGLACATCHAATMADTQSPKAPVVERGACFDCHDSKKVAAASASKCASCHGRNERKVAPADHKAPAWLASHGRASEQTKFNPLHGQDCSTCHQQSDCRTCHTTERPRSHTALWRVRTHGQAAAWDRDSCKTCHETGSCAACHTRTAPENHRGAWMATHGLAAQVRDQEHCTTCHTPATCTACHQGVNR